MPATFKLIEFPGVGKVMGIIDAITQCCIHAGIQMKAGGGCTF